MDERSPEPVSDDSPRWRAMYVIVIGELVLLVFLMWLFTKAFE